VDIWSLFIRTLFVWQSGTNSSYLSDMEGGSEPVSQCVGLSVIVSLNSPPAIN
jgi:hypothetical protein